MLINCLKHDIVVFDGEEEIVIHPSGSVIRMEERVAWVKQIEGVPGEVSRIEFTIPTGIPETEPGDILIVSAVCASSQYMKVYASTHGITLISPDTGESAKRNAAGQVIGVSGFRMF